MKAIEMILSIVIPVYNEEENLVELYRRLTKTSREKAYIYEIIFVDDGSSDNSCKILREFYLKDRGIRIIKLKRNFGQIPAILAGIKIANGDTIITLDADLQNPPEEIPKFIEKINEGYTAVFGYRIKRKDYFLRKLGSFILWHFISFKTGRIIKDPGCGFNALRKELIDTIIRKHGENLKNIKHMIVKESNSIVQVAVNHFPWRKGKSKYSFLKLITYGLGFLKEIFGPKITINVSSYEIDAILE